MTVYDCLSLPVLMMTTPIQMLYSTTAISPSPHSASAVLSMLVTMSSITTLLVITKTLLSTSPTSFFVFVNAFGESPMGNMEPSDVALPSIHEFDERIRKFNAWIHGDYLLSETTVSASSHDETNNNSSSSSSHQVFNTDDQQQEINSKKRNLSEILKTTQEQNETSKHQKSSRTFTDSDDFVVPFEIRRVSKDAAVINSNNNNNKRSSSSKYLPNQDPSNSDYLIKVFATKDIKADFAELRVLAKHVLSFHTICPKTAKRLIEKSASSSSSSSANKNISDRQSEEREWLKQEEKDGEVESFCLLAEYLHEKLSSQPSSNHQNSASCFQGVLLGSAEGGKNSNQNDQQTSSSSSSHPIPLPFNVEDFEISMMSLFLVYSRWGSGYESSNTASFFKPMIDLFPRVPASPICTFTDSDLSILTPSLRREIKSEREFIEEQWKEGIFDSIFFDSSSSSSSTTNSNSNPYLSSFEKRRSEKMENLFHKLFPQDALTLPRFFWAQCTLKSKLSKCFDAGQPCVFPILDLAGYRTELSVYSPRHLAKPNEWRGYASQLAYLQEQQVLVPVHQQQNDDIQDSSENVNNNDNNDEQSSSSPSKKKKSKKLKKRNRNKNKNQNRQQVQENSNGDAAGDDSVPKKLVTRKRIITRTSLVDSVTRDDNNNQLYAVLRFSYALSKGQELTLDRERRAMPFMRRGIIDHNNRARCVTVNLPTLSMKEKMDSYLKKIHESSSSTTQQQQQQQVESPRKLFKEDPSDAYIASLYNPCLGFVFDKSDLHPQIEAKLNRILSLQQQQQQQQSNQEQEQEDQLSPSSSVNLLQKQAEKFNQQPYTCIHLSQDSVLNFVTMVEGLGIFEDNCTIESLESEIPIESTPETQLRSVALAGKLIRAQLERISTALSKVEETYISTSNQLKKTLNKKTKKTKSEMLKKSLQEEKQEQEQQHDAVSKETEIVQEKPSPNNINKRSSSSNKKNIKKKNKKSSSSSSVPSSYKEYMKQQRKKSLENFVASDDEMNINENNDDDEIENSSPKYIKASLEELSSCSPESPTKCKILSDPFPRHLTLIQDYLQNEHAGLVQIYETLTQMRDYLRKELESKDYLKN